MITASNLRKIYPDGTTGLKNLSVTVGPGEIVGVLGPSGAGKTTFFRLLNGSLLPSGGEITVLDRSLGRLSRSRLKTLRTQVALVYQHHNVIPALSVARNVMLGRLGRLSWWETLRNLVYLREADRQRIWQLLDRMGLADKMFNRCEDLSGGQQQRVAVARALMAEPELVLADEPIASVDTRTAELILNTFTELADAGKTVLINLHQVDFALQYCRRLLVLEHGELVFDGKPGDFTGTELYRDKFARTRGVNGAVDSAAAKGGAVGA